MENRESPDVMIEIESGEDDHDKKGKMISEMLMQLLLQQMSPEAVKQQIMAMIQDKPEEVKQKIMDKITYLLEMKLAGGEIQAMHDPMLNGQMPEGFDQRHSELSGQATLYGS